MMKRKIPTVVATVFMVAMMLLTFFSKTIYRNTLPNVKLVYPKGGSLSYQFVAYAYTLSGDESTPYYIPVKLDMPLSVDAVYVSENDEIVAGAPILHFYEPEADIALKKAIQKKTEAFVRWRVWNDSYENAMTAAEQKFKEAKTAEEKERATSELALLRDGIHNGTSKDLVYEEYMESSRLVDALTMLQQEKWTVTAPYAGVVGKVYVSKGDYYAGISPLMDLYTAEVKPDIVLELKNFPQHYTEAWTCTITLTDKYGRVDCTLKRLEKMEANAARVIISPNGACEYSTIAQIAVTVKTPYQPLLVPNHVLQGKECYVLDEKTGAWGQTVYTAKRVMLSVGASNDAYTAVQDGLSKGDILIVSSTLPISDGCVVVVEQ